MLAAIAEAFTCPCTTKNFYAFVSHGASQFLIQPEAGKLVWAIAASDAEFEPSAGEYVEHGGVFGEF